MKRRPLHPNDRPKFGRGKWVPRENGRTLVKKNAFVSPERDRLSEQSTSARHPRTQPISHR